MRLLAVLLAGIWIAAMSVAPVSAHVSENNNGVSAVLHVLPDDNPVAGEKTYVQFSFGNSGTPFQVEQCGCQLAVNEDGKDIQKLALEPLDPGSSKSLSMIEFPSGGVYNLVITGYTDASRERSFELDYLLRVAEAGKGGANTAAGLQVIMLSVAILGILAGTAYYGIKDNPRYNAGSQLRSN